MCRDGCLSIGTIPKAGRWGCSARKGFVGKERTVIGFDVVLW